VETPQRFDQKSINEAQGFLLTLSGFDFNIFLQIYGLVFPFTQNLYNILQSKSMDILFCVKEIETTMKKLEEIKTSKFSGIWKNVTERCGMPTCRKVRFSLQPEVQYRALFFEIMDTILVQLKHRFKSVMDIGFVELLDCKQFHFYNFVNNFPERSFKCLQEMYKFRFEFSCLRSELQVLYSHSDFRKNSIEELHRYMCENDLYGGFMEVHKLVILVLIIPYSTASVEHSFSALKRVKTYLKKYSGPKETF